MQLEPIKVIHTVYQINQIKMGAKNLFIMKAIFLKVSFLLFLSLSSLIHQNLN